MNSDVRRLLPHLVRVQLVVGQQIEVPASGTEGVVVTLDTLADDTQVLSLTYAPDGRCFQGRFALGDIERVLEHAERINASGLDWAILCGPEDAPGFAAEARRALAAFSDGRPDTVDYVPARKGVQ
jgi:hypothetical protein